MRKKHIFLIITIFIFLLLVLLPYQSNIVSDFLFNKKNHINTQQITTTKTYTYGENGFENIPYGNYIIKYKNNDTVIESNSQHLQITSNLGGNSLDTHFAEQQLISSVSYYAKTEEYDTIIYQYWQKVDELLNEDNGQRISVLKPCEITFIYNEIEKFNIEKLTYMEIVELGSAADFNNEMCFNTKKQTMRP